MEHMHFVSRFIADVLDPGVYTRGAVTLRQLTEKHESLIVRVEDALLDELYTAFYNSTLTDVGSSFKNNGSSNKTYFHNINALARVQKKTCVPPKESYSPTTLSGIPVFYPLYIFLSELSHLQYPVALLHSTPDLIKGHPAISSLGFPVIPKERIHYYTGGIIVSPYKEDGVDMLFPRSFNKDVADTAYTLTV